MNGSKTRLAEVLAAYGADPVRWPVSEREALAALVRDEPELLAEAREIDRVLAGAGAPKIPEGAKARLLARARAEGQGKSEAAVIPLDPARARAAGAPRSAIWSWGAAAALAASFAFGMFLGTTNFAPWRTTYDVVEIDDPIVLTGIDDAPDLLEGNGR